MTEPNLIRAFLEQASAKGSKSTILKPLAWMMTICISATLTSAHFSLYVWIVYLFAGFSCITMALYLIAYLYCLVKDRDALRSETYSIQKMAIEKGFVGDDISGVLPIERAPSGQLIENTSRLNTEVDK
tara:strand:- start:3204 stop:3590 length:387 start_codon:yes stop_codon:yes gene_type:complete